MNKIILKFINIYKIFIFIALFTFNFALCAQDNSNFKQVEATGRSILLPENIENHTIEKHHLEMQWVILYLFLQFFLCVKDSKILQ